MTEPLQLAIVGLGRMGSYHAESLMDVPQIDVCAVVDPQPERRAAAAALYPAARQFDDVDQLLGDGACEAVLVASPTPHHPEVVAAALDAGLHVMCEKPLALDPAVALSLAGRAEEAGLVLQVGHWRRFAPPWAAAKDAIAAGRIGKLVLIRLSQWDADPPPPEFCDPAVSGGLAIDCGVHEFDLAEWLTGSPIVEVEGHALPVVDAGVAAAGDVDNLLITGRLDGGAGFVVDLSRNARYGDDVRTEILGSDGVIVAELLPAGSSRIGTSRGWAVLEDSAADDAMRAGVRAQAVAFARRVRTGDGDIPDGRTSARSVALGHAAMRSLSDGRTVSV